MTQCVIPVLECLKDQQYNGGVMAARDWIYIQVVEKYICKRKMSMLNPDELEKLMGHYLRLISKAKLRGDEAQR